MKNLDLVIVESLQLEDYMISELHEAGVKVYGYISAWEVSRWDDSLGSKLKKSDYLYINDKLIYHTNDPIGDLREEHYRDSLLEIISERIVSKNLDGIFIDSTSVLNDYYHIPELGPGLFNGYIQLLKDIQTEYPQLEVVQNRGFAYVKSASDYLDGVVWENFSSPRVNEIRRYKERVELLKSLPEHIQIYTISYDDFKENLEHANDLGWIHLNHQDGTQHNYWIPTHVDTLATSKSDFRIYYNHITDEILADMKNLKFVIVKPNEIEKEMVEELHVSGTNIYGYISAWSVDQKDDALNSQLTKSDFLYIDGVLMYHHSDPIGDLRQEGYREALLNTINDRIIENNLDGIFMDSTSALNDYYHIPEVGPELLEGYIQLLDTIQNKHPNLKIIQNRGFAYTHSVSEYLDGVMWSNFISPKINGISRYESRIELLQNLPEHIQIYTVSYDDFYENLTHSNDLGWIHLNNPNGTHFGKWIPMK